MIMKNNNENDNENENYKVNDIKYIVIEVIRTVYYYYYYYFFYQDILHKKTHKLYSNISIHLKSIIKNTSNFHSDAKQ